MFQQAIIPFSAESDKIINEDREFIEFLKESLMEADDSKFLEYKDLMSNYEKFRMKRKITTKISRNGAFDAISSTFPLSQRKRSNHNVYRFTSLQYKTVFPLVPLMEMVAIFIINYNGGQLWQTIWTQRNTIIILSTDMQVYLFEICQRYKKQQLLPTLAQYYGTLDEIKSSLNVRSNRIDVKCTNNAILDKDVTSDIIHDKPRMTPQGRQMLQNKNELVIPEDERTELLSGMKTFLQPFNNDTWRIKSLPVI
jgi:hypothetical protein